MEHEYLPEVYTSFRERFGDTATALDQLGAAAANAGPLNAKTQRLVKLGIAIGQLSSGAVRSNTRKAIDLGATAAEIRHVAILAITTAGFPTAVAGLGWINEVLEGDRPAAAEPQTG